MIQMMISLYVSYFVFLKEASRIYEQNILFTLFIMIIQVYHLQDREHSIVPKQREYLEYPL